MPLCPAFLVGARNGVRAPGHLQQAFYHLPRATVWISISLCSATKEINVKEMVWLARFSGLDSKRGWIWNNTDREACLKEGLAGQRDRK